MQNVDFEIIEKRKTKIRSVKAWSQHQDRLLKKFYEQHPRQWSIICSLIPQRNQNQCLHRYRRLCQKGMNHTKNWSEEEDSVVQKLIKRIGKNWKLVSEMLGSKTGKQIRERYINKLDPDIKKNAWSREEDFALIKCIKEFGSRWSEIAKNLPGRPENVIKNRFYSYIRKNYEIRDKLKQEEEEGEQNINGDILCEEERALKRQTPESQNQHQQIPLIPSIMQIQEQGPTLKQIQNIDMIDIKTFNHFSQQDLFYLLNTR